MTIAAVGKAKASPELSLFQDYAKRLSWKLQLVEIAPGKTEAEALLKAVESSHKIIALDERGKDIGSELFARQIGDWQNQGASSLGFIIGGADGLADNIRRRADLLLAFGKLTWPHMLVRALLAEQLYRAQTILSGHPYHRS